MLDNIPDLLHVGFVACVIWVLTLEFFGWNSRLPIYQTFSNHLIFLHNTSVSLPPLNFVKRIWTRWVSRERVISLFGVNVDKLSQHGLILPADSLLILWIVKILSIVTTWNYLLTFRRPSIDSRLTRLYFLKTPLMHIKAFASISYKACVSFNVLWSYHFYSLENFEEF